MYGMRRGSAEDLTLPIRHSEAIELVTAFVAHTAHKIDARVLLIKGRTLEQQGLRKSHVSSDVDVLIFPSDLDPMLRELAAAGWHASGGLDIVEQFAESSPTLVHEFWGVPIDVHVVYPGLLMDSSAAFEILWLDRDFAEFAGQRVPVPNRVASAIILALHSIRSTKTMSRHKRELDDLVNTINTEWSADDKQRLSDLALELHATATLEPLLSRIGLKGVIALDEGERRMFANWNRRVATGSAPISFWAHQVSIAPLRKRFFLLWRAFWPTEHDLRAARPNIAAGRRASFAARWMRWRRGFASLRLMLKNRRGPDSRFLP